VILGSVHSPKRPGTRQYVPLDSGCWWLSLRLRISERGREREKRKTAISITYQNYLGIQLIYGDNQAIPIPVEDMKPIGFRDLRCCWLHWFERPALPEFARGATFPVFDLVRAMYCVEQFEIMAGVSPDIWMRGGQWTILIGTGRVAKIPRLLFPRLSFRPSPAKGWKRDPGNGSSFPPVTVSGYFCLHEKPYHILFRAVISASFIPRALCTVVKQIGIGALAVCRSLDHWTKDFGVTFCQETDCGENK